MIVDLNNKETKYFFDTALKYFKELKNLIIRENPPTYDEFISVLEFVYSSNDSFTKGEINEVWVDEILKRKNLEYEVAKNNMRELNAFLGEFIKQMKEYKTIGSNVESAFKQYDNLVGLLELMRGE